jgi:hypothetical protein
MFNVLLVSVERRNEETDVLDLYSFASKAR